MARVIAVAEDFGMVTMFPQRRSPALALMATMLQQQITTRVREDRLEAERVRRTYLPRRTWRIKKIRARRRR